MTGEGYMRVAQAGEIFRIVLANLGFRRFELHCAPGWSYLEWLLDDFVEVQGDRLQRLQAGAEGGARAAREARKRIRAARMLQFILYDLMARSLYRAAGLPMPVSTRKAMALTRELIPTLRPLSEITSYVGEALDELREGADLVLNVGPNSCMVASMGEVLTPAIVHAAGAGHGRVQHLLSADGDVNEELLTVALLKAMGPERYYAAARTDRSAGSRQAGFQGDRVASA